MAKSVISAFNIFLKDIINLDSEQTKNAKSSRDWLVEKVNNFQDIFTEFPKVYKDKNIFFGSFARRTKKRPLDDIDIMIALNAEGSSYIEGSNTIKIHVPDSASRLNQLCNDDTNTLNSRKVINLFVKKLKDINQYKKAEINRNQEAATLQLSSYDWNFDIVPCFFTVPDYLGKTYYLIPDGDGNWKKTDPRIDRDRVTDINTKHDGNVLNVIRIMKYWNARSTMPSMSSYLLETMILNYYEIFIGKALEFVDLELADLFLYISNNIYNTIQDPKNIQGNINNLTSEEKCKISERARADQFKAINARHFEREHKHKESINKWREIFGEEFPKYE